MQSSSGPIVCAAVLAALVIAYFPSLITPDALAQTTTLPYPDLISITNVAPAAPAPIIVRALGSKTVATTTAFATTATAFAPSPDSGFRLTIPSIGLDDPIVPVGITAGNAMAVPSGKTDQVGWYDGGTKPGDAGSAVLDAHVFAAFANLDQVKVGDSVYVTEGGKLSQFKVTAIKTYALSQITSSDLFAQTSDHDLNLITCAGKLTADHSTYDHRLVVYTTLVS